MKLIGKKHAKWWANIDWCDSFYYWRNVKAWLAYTFYRWGKDISGKHVDLGDNVIVTDLSGGKIKFYKGHIAVTEGKVSVCFYDEINMYILPLRQGENKEIAKK